METGSHYRNNRFHEEEDSLPSTSVRPKVNPSVRNFVYPNDEDYYQEERGIENFDSNKNGYGNFNSYYDDDEDHQYDDHFERDDSPQIIEKSEFVSYTERIGSLPPAPIPPPNYEEETITTKSSTKSSTAKVQITKPSLLDDIPIKASSKFQSEMNKPSFDEIPVKINNGSAVNSNRSASTEHDDFVVDFKTKAPHSAVEKKSKPAKNGPFPFLKRGSRKEPSALHKKPDDKSKSKSGDDDQYRNERMDSSSFEITAASSKAEKKMGGTLKQQNNVQAAAVARKDGNDSRTNPPPSSVRKPSTENYWGLDTTIVADLDHLKNEEEEKYDRGNHYLEGPYSRSLGPDDTLDNIVARTVNSRANNNVNHQNSNRFHRQDEEDGNYEDGNHDNESEASVEYEKFLRSKASANSPSWGHATQPKPYVPSDDPYYNDEEVPRDLINQQPKVLLAKSTTQRLRQLRSTTPNARAQNPNNNNHSLSSSNAATSKVPESPASSNNSNEKVSRPVSSLKKDIKSNSTNPPNRKATPSNNGKSNNPVNATGHYLVSEENQKLLEQKMVELQQEIEIYKNKISKIQKTEKLKEQELSDVLLKKEEIMRQCEEEKLQTKKWCEEQRQALEREKKYLAKQAKEIRAKSTDPPIRKEKAEMDALKATIEKLKLNYETSHQKWKLDTNRLHELVKDYSGHIENLEKQLVIIEEQKIELMEFINENGLKLPKNIRQKLAQSDNHAKEHNLSKQKESLTMKQTSLLQKQSTKIAGNKGYAEEVDIEVFQGTVGPSSSYQYKIIPEENPSRSKTIDRSRKPIANSTIEDDRDGESFNEYDEVEEGKVSNSYSNRKDYTLPPGEIFNRLSSNLKNGFSGAKSSGGTKQKSSSKNSSTLTNSWAVRSSRSSARYSSSLEEDEEGGTDYQETSNFDDQPNESQDDILGQLLDRHHQQQQHHQQPVQQYPPQQQPLQQSRHPQTSAPGNNQRYEKMDTTADYYSNNPTMNNSNLAKKSTFEKMKSLTSTELDESYKRTPPPPNRASSTASMNLKNSAPTAPTSSSSTHALGNKNNDNNANGPSRSEEIRADGTKVIHYRNGTTKEVYPTGHTLVRFTNGDTKFSDTESGKVIYFYSQANTTHTTFGNGLELYQFPNGQTEKHYPDGKKEVIFPDKTKKIIYTDGSQESVFPDGVILKEYADGRKEVLSSATTFNEQY